MSRTMSEVLTTSTNTDNNSIRVDAIDGLRAIAVFSVIAFHFNFGFAPSGFIGVDIFFVISGYVISLSLTQNLRQSAAEYILAFYKRRMLRIIPALVFCLLIVSLLSTLFIPHSWLSARNNTTGVFAFFGLSNFALLSGADGYFNYRAQFNTFLHTWSLAVEEQFYVFFPLLFLFWLKHRQDQKKGLIIAKHSVMLLGILSLVWAAIETPRAQELAFYMLPSRFWELAAGAVLFQYHSAGHLTPNHKNTTQLITFIGAALIAVSMTQANYAAFPFPWALVPVTGTLFLIAATRSAFAHELSVFRFLKNPIIVYLGKSSYSLYLWHWPIAVMLRWTIGFDSVQTIIVGFLLTLLLGLSSYHFIEKPFLYSPKWRSLPARQTVLIGIICTVSAALLACGIMLSNKIRLSVVEHETGWHAHDLPSALNFKHKSTQNTQHTIWVIGDSHADAYQGMIQEAASQLGMAFRIESTSGCPVANLRSAYADTFYCRDVVNKLMNVLSEKAHPGDIVFLASLRAQRLSDQWGELTPEKIEMALSSEANPKHNDAALKQSKMIIEHILSLGLTVMIDTPKPVFRAPPFRCADWFNKMNSVCTPGFTVSADLLKKHNALVLNNLKVLKSSYPTLVVWDPFPILCPTDVCSAFKDGKPLFFDQDHLSGYGNELLLSSFSELLRSINTANIN